MCNTSFKQFLSHRAKNIHWLIVCTKLKLLYHYLKLDFSERPVVDIVSLSLDESSDHKTQLFCCHIHNIFLFHLTADMLHGVWFLNIVDRRFITDGPLILVFDSLSYIHFTFLHLKNILRNLIYIPIKQMRLSR